MYIWYRIILYIPVVPHKAVLEVAEGKVNINQQKNVPIGIDCDLLNPSHSMSTSHSISHVTLFSDDPNKVVWQKCTIAWLHSTTPYCKVLLCTTQYFKGLLRTTKYYKVHATTPSYKVLQSTTQYYSVLKSASKHYSVLQSITLYYKVAPYYKVLQSTTPFESRNTWNVIYIRRSMGCKIMELRHSCLIVATHEMSFTPGGATYVMQNTLELRHWSLIVATWKVIQVW